MFAQNVEIQNTKQTNSVQPVECSVKYSMFRTRNLQLLPALDVNILKFTKLVQAHLEISLISSLINQQDLTRNEVS